MLTTKPCLRSTIPRNTALARKNALVKFSVITCSQSSSLKSNTLGHRGRRCLRAGIGESPYPAAVTRRHRRDVDHKTVFAFNHPSQYGLGEKECAGEI